MEGIAIFVDERLRFVSPEAAGMLGYARADEALGRLLDAFVAPGEASWVASLRGAWEEADPRPVRRQLDVLRKDGSAVPLDVSVSPARYEGAPAVQLVLHRAGEEHAREQWTARRARLAMMGELVAGVAHELNNPLTGIVGYAKLLAAEPHSPQLRTDLGKIEHEAERAARIVRNLLSLARYRKPARRMTDINQLVVDTLELQAYHLRTSGIDVQMLLDPSLPLTAAEPQQIQQALLNLIVNAEQAIAPASRRGRLTVATVHDGQTIEIRVADNGCGIPHELLERVFEPRFTTKAGGQGTGLGLAISRDIVREHGGSLRVESEAGSGAAFTIVLPIAIVDGALEAAPAAQAGAPPRRRWLVVDDEEVVVEVLRRVLESEGQQVESALGAQEALERLARSTFDYVIVDVRMPDMSGEEVKALIDYRLPHLRGRVALCTGDVLSDRSQALLRSTNAPVIEKPFIDADLRRTIRSMLACPVAEARS